eukprot:g2884.t1
MESTILCLDNSEWMRNGDYMPSRLGAQLDAVNTVSNRRINPPSHPENTVGIMTSAGRTPEVLCTPTRDQSLILTATEEVKVSGKSKVYHAIKVALLALKHRTNKNGGQRIAMFVGSPVEDDKKKLTKVGKELKKNGVAIDVILLGPTEGTEKEDKMDALIKAADKEGNSHLIVIPPGQMPSEVLRSSHLCVQGGSVPTGGEGGNAAAAVDQFAEYGGFDPSIDPEMAQVMRMSLMEERQRQEAQLKAAEEKEEGASAGSATATTATTEASAGNLNATEENSSGATSTSPEATELTDEQLLNQALAMSMAAAAGESSSSSTEVVESMDVEEEDDDAALQAALALSQQDTSTASTTNSGNNDAPPIPAAAPLSGPPSATFFDPAFVQGLLHGLPGVDPNDPRIKAAMSTLGRGAKKKDSDKDKDGGGK